MKYAYIRVSTKSQSIDRQLKAFKDIQDIEVFIDKYSGKEVSKLPRLNELLKVFEEGDKLYITDIDRLGRDALGVLNILKILEDKGVKLHIINSPFRTVDFKDYNTMFMLQMQVITAEFYRKAMLSVQKGGISSAKELGRYKRPKKTKLKKQDEILELIKKGFNNSETAKILGVSRQHVINVLRKKGEDNA